MCIRDRPKPIIKKPIPVISIPTTSGTGSEVTPYAVLTNSEKCQKGTIQQPEIFPKMAIIVPEFMISMPKKLTASTGIDAFAHALESLINISKKSPISELVSYEALKIIFKNLNLENEEEVLQLFALKISRGGKAPLTGEVITDARQDLDQSSRPSISMQMNSNGAKNWRRLTSLNVGRRIAIVLDNFVYSAPFVQNEIPNGNSQITGDFTIEEAQDLANILKAGTLPAPTTIVEDVVIGPTLGKVAQSQGFQSIMTGLVIVLVFMVFYYSGGGLSLIHI